MAGVYLLACAPKYSSLALIWPLRDVKLGSTARLPTIFISQMFRPQGTTPPLFLDFDSKARALEKIQQPSTMQTPSGPLFPESVNSSPLQTSSLARLTHRDECTAPHTPPIDPALFGVEKSIYDMEMESYKIRDEALTKRQSDTQTKKTYNRYVEAYQKWWDLDQFARHHQNPDYATIPAFPILPGKVVLFLKHETTRGKVISLCCMISEYYF